MDGERKEFNDYPAKAKYYKADRESRFARSNFLNGKYKHQPSLLILFDLTANDYDEIDKLLQLFIQEHHYEGIDKDKVIELFTDYVINDLKRIVQ